METVDMSRITFIWFHIMLFLKEWSTVPAFNSGTSRPDVWQCLFVQTFINSKSKNKPEPINDVSNKDTLCCEVIYVSLPRKLGDNRACSRVLCPGCPRIWCRNYISTPSAILKWTCGQSCSEVCIRIQITLPIFYDSTPCLYPCICSKDVLPLIQYFKQHACMYESIGTPGVKDIRMGNFIYRHLLCLIEDNS